MAMQMNNTALPPLGAEATQTILEGSHDEIGPTTTADDLEAMVRAFLKDTREQFSAEAHEPSVRAHFLSVYRAHQREVAENPRQTMDALRTHYTTSGPRGVRWFEAIQLDWSRVEAILGRAHDGSAEDDQYLVAWLEAYGAPDWVASAGGWIDETGWGLIGPRIEAPIEISNKRN